MNNQIEFAVWGKYALFSDPINKMGGEKLTYQVPTYEALKGITSSIYWKPTFTWFIDRLRIIKPIHSQSKGMRPIRYNSSKSDLSIYTYLCDVFYQVQAHFEWNENRPELKEDRNEKKHLSIAQRSIEKGGRRDIFLGTRECQGYVKPCTFGEGEGFYDEYGEIPLGVMVHGITYPDENANHQMKINLWSPIMRNGIIEFLRPEDCKIQKNLRAYEPKSFILNENISEIK